MGSGQQGHDTTKVFSTPILGDVEVVDVPFPLPLDRWEMKEKGTKYFIKAYCNKCGKDTVHVIYVDSGNDFVIKCTACEGKVHIYARKIDAFVKLYCPTCQRETVHALTSSFLKCVGCGRFIDLD